MMKPSYAPSLRLWLPTIIAVVFLVLWAIMTANTRKQLEVKLIEKSIRFLTYDLNLLNREIEKDSSQNNQNQARQALTNRGVDTHYKVLLVTDDQGTILYSNQFKYSKRLAQDEITEFDLDQFKKLQRENRSSIRHVPDQKQIIAYFPVTLNRLSSEIRPQRIGALFAVYDLKNDYKQIWSQVWRTSLPIGAILLIAMIGILKLLHFFVISPINHLSRVAQDLDIMDKNFPQSNLRGSGKIAQLGKVFNIMISHIESTVKEIKRSEEKFRILVETSPYCIHQIDLNGKFISMNRAGLKMINETDEASIVGQDYLDSVSDNDKEYVRSLMQKSFNDSVSDFKFESVNKHYFQSNFVPIKEDNKVIRLLGITQDITAQKKAQIEKENLSTQLIQSQKLEAIGTLASGVAHEVNNPINGIMNYAQLMVDRLPKEDPLNNYAREIIVESKRIATIVRNLLAFSRKDSETSLHPENASVIVNRSLSLIRTIMKHSQIEFSLSMPEDLPLIMCRDQQLQQVIMNLITNACAATNSRYPDTSENKKINIHGRSIFIDDQEWLRITVEDFGTGIPNDIIDRIFDPFFTTKDRTKGTGLGLSISHGIVQEHNGRLSVESTYGKGSRFHMDIPAIQGC